MYAQLKKIHASIKEATKDQKIVTKNYSLSDLLLAMTMNAGDVTFEYEDSRRGDNIDFAASFIIDDFRLNIDFTTNRVNFNVYQSDIQHGRQLTDWYWEAGQAVIDGVNDRECTRLLTDIVTLVTDAC